MLYLDDGIPVNSATFANEETLFELIGAELLVEHSPTAGGFAEAAGTELWQRALQHSTYRYAGFTPVSLLAEFATCSLPHSRVRYLS